MSTSSHSATTPAPEHLTAMDAHSEHLRLLIREEIAAAGGTLPFDRFMELALYAPGLGYYSAGAMKLGPAGDFVTAPEISPLFGRCVATQCAEVLRALGGGDLLELGAGTGALAVQVLAALATLSQLPNRYLILEPSPDLAERQRALVAERLPTLRQLVHWVPRVPADLRGMVIANEVLDAMPVHRFCLPPLTTAGAPNRADVEAAVREVLVICDDDGLKALVDRPVTPGLAAAVAALDLPAATLALGLSSEINLRLAPWLAMLAERLAVGMLLLIDYGYPRREYYSPERREGTLLCHHRHRAHDDPYTSLGLQDITAHVDFTAVAEAGAAAGLDLAGYTTQAHFLLGCGLDRHLSAAAGEPEALLDLAAGVKQLVLPAAMGERFQAIALTRNLDAPEGGWCGFAQRDLRARL